MELKRCIVLEALNSMGGSLSLDKLAALLFMAERISGVNIFNWTIEEGLLFSNDLLDELESMGREGLVNISGNLVALVKEINVGCFGWAYDRIRGALRDVAARIRSYGDSEAINAALSYAYDHENV